MKKFATLLFSALTSVQVAFAADQAQKDAAAELLDMMELDTIMNQTIEQMLNIQVQQNPSLGGQFKDVMMKFFNKHMSYKSLKPDLVEIYAEAFSTEELRDLIAFYGTPTGAKALRVMPQLMAQSSQLGLQKVQQNAAELQRMISAKLAEQAPAE